MEGLGEAAGKVPPVELEVQTVAEETTQPREVGVEADPETVLQTTFCILEPQDQPAPAVQLVALQTTVVVVVVDLAPIPTTLEIRRMVPRVEQVGVVVVLTTGFVKADSMSTAPPPDITELRTPEVEVVQVQLVMLEAT
jgi:hypothetical protein